MFDFNLFWFATGIVVGGTVVKSVPIAWSYLKNQWAVKFVIGWFKKSDSTDPKQ